MRAVGIKPTDTTWCPTCHATTIGVVCGFCTTRTEKYTPRHEHARARAYALLRRKAGLDHRFALQLVHEVVGL